MPRRIEILAPKEDLGIDVTLQLALALLRKQNVGIAAGSIIRHDSESVRATVLLKREADKPRALKILAEAGFEAQASTAPDEPPKDSTAC